MTRAGLMGMILALSLGLGSAQAVAQTPPTAEAFAREQAILSPSLSPDGRHLAALVSVDGGPHRLMIWRANDLEREPVVIGSDTREEIVGVSFIKNDRLFVTTQQWSTNTGFGRIRGGYLRRTRVITLDGDVIPTPDFPNRPDNEQLHAFYGLGVVVSALPAHPTDILIQPWINGDVFSYNTSNGRYRRVRRGSDEFGGERTDMDGRIRARTQFSFDNDAAYVAQWILNLQTGQWEEHFRSYARDRDYLSIIAFTNEPHILLVQGARGRDRSVIWEYNTQTRAFADEPAFEHPMFDALSVVQSQRESDYGEIVGFTYEAERVTTYWLDPDLEAAQAAMRSALEVEMGSITWTDIDDGRRVRFSAPVDEDVGVIDSSQDRRTVLFERSGPGQPPEYYLLVGGRARLIGRAYPEIDPQALGDTRILQYEARDGLMIPAFLTTPNPAQFGPGPYPMIVTPHGGPWARDYLDWDATGWTQYFAARGYAVLQPQFRGSDGWGQRLWRAGDQQWGLAMQDDLDDGVSWAIRQGVAAPDRVAIHGYSYGGYAAMMAAIRPNGLYQCAIAGAGPASLNEIRQRTYDNRYLREFQHPTIAGRSPIDDIDQVSIPIYLYTGDTDATVFPHESQAYADALTAAGKPVRLRILERMQHGLYSWTPENTAAMLTTVENYLRTDCHPGGL
ncbi:MAG: S9 family peptidase [Caulobacterales bacterium]|nr:S9 family peptidase [Caulobacterales bacterium]